ncbi:fungal specific transcription factor domain-containing protein [Aspergillus tubingensis]|uniref:fungal specific transcription factor domain-containing protein n=1 Tax=Aspergillus tubingensis TaxID=5068 RepID=UPI001577B7B3|nr:NAD dependent epimerase/dehydratase family protein [Aspergillus tubingensis]GFN11786.1 NAD dependent epimerase/dehydratase family protein [Aspergillus tubingensis]
MDRRKRRTGDAVRNPHSRAIDRQDGFSQSNSATAAENENTPFEFETLVSEMVTPESRSDDTHPPETSLRERLSLAPEQSTKVDVGETSAMSFLHFLRKTIKAYVGSVPFTDAERHHIIIDTDFCSTTEDDQNIEPKRIHSYIEYYYEATSGILDLFTAQEVETLLEAHTSSRQPTSIAAVRREDVAAIGVALSIGAQIRGSDRDSQVANEYFRRARQAAFNDMLMGQNIGTVRLFLLMAFYMLGACNRNAASMFLGVAARAAIILELHSIEGYDSTLSKEDCESRRRIWHSMRNLDILSSFVLSRPRSLPLVQSMSDTNELNPQSAFYAIGNGCTLLINIVDTLSNGGLLDVPTAEGLLSQLRKWSSSLPASLRQFRSVSQGPPFLEPAARQRLVGSVHVSCLYYFAVILVTRPYLIAYLVSRLRGKAPDHLISDPDEASDVAIKNNKVSKLAQVCVSSSLYMIDMCRRAKSAGLVFRNFCLLKAWIFGAGLILGFSMFAGEPRRDIESLFNSTLHLLDDIGRTSPQARLYHQILTSLNDAVTKFRNRVAGEVYRTVQDYMDQILMIDPTVDGGSTAHARDREDSYTVWNDDWLAGAIRSAETGEVALDPVLNGTHGAQMFHDLGDWGDIDGMELEEDLLMDIDPFDQFFFTVE